MDQIAVGFHVVTQFGEIQIYTRELTAERAQRLAEARRLDGADVVRVYDQAWAFLSASDLAMAAAQRQGAASGRSSEAGSLRFAVKAEPAPDAPSSASDASLRSRVRVFKASKAQRD